MNSDNHKATTKISINISNIKINYINIIFSHFIYHQHYEFHLIDLLDSIKLISI